MPNFFENLDFSGNSINVSLVLNFVLLENFDCNFLLSDGMDTQFDLSKRSLTKCLVNEEMRNLSQLSLLLFLGCAIA